MRGEVCMGKKFEERITLAKIILSKLEKRALMICKIVILRVCQHSLNKFSLEVI